MGGADTPGGGADILGEELTFQGVGPTPPAGGGGGDGAKHPSSFRASSLLTILCPFKYWLSQRHQPLPSPGIPVPDQRRASALAEPVAWGRQS